jgi:hypothetical protein
MGHKRKSKKGFVQAKQDHPASLEATPIRANNLQVEPDPTTAEAAKQSVAPVQLSRLTARIAAAIIVALGILAFFTGLSGPFMDNDGAQITNNPVVQSVTHIRFLFEGGTFYTGAGIAPLTGSYFRPLTTTAYSLIYTLFGPSALAFHIFQLILCLATAFLAFLLFRYTFRPVVALLLSLIFLLHPIDSQSVFAIASLQEPLSLFFGLLALWVLLRFSSVRSLVTVAVCLFLSMLANETGVLCAAMSLLYLYWFNRERLWALVKVFALPLAIYVGLRIHAVGIIHYGILGPIDQQSLIGRIMTMPAIILFYFSRLLFPLKLSAGYYWVYPTFSWSHVLVPLIIDGLIAVALLFGGKLVHKSLASQYSLTYRFFACWLLLGLVAVLPLIPQDTTVSEAWFYSPMIGLLGMLGLIAVALRPSRRAALLAASISVILILFLGIRTAFRGVEWQSLDSRATHDVSASTEDYVAYNDLAAAAVAKGNYNQAKEYDQKSVAIFPTYDSYVQLGLAQSHMGSYDAAITSYHRATSYGQAPEAYEYVCENLLFSKTPTVAIQFIEDTLKLYPRDSTLWTYYAMLAADIHDSATAKKAISNAAQYGEVPPVIYNDIASGQSFQLSLTNISKTVSIGH